MTLTVTETRLEAGDTIELGEVQGAETNVGRGGGLKLIAAHSGDTEQYVVIRFTTSDGEEIEADGQVLAVEEGSGMAAPTVWLALPKEEYES